jgi:hypothetical protein
MPHYDVEVVVTFSGTIHANSEAEAHDFAHTNWSDESGAQIQYQEVDRVRATEIDAEEDTDNCPDGGCPDVEEYEAQQEEDEAEDE